MSAPASTSSHAPDVAEQRDALHRILESGILDRAPNLAIMLRYVCERHFAGKISEIKEYSIAVDAFGRSPDFDQKKDAIVRVEAHRLRKRLTEYYRTIGSNDPVEISLPAGTYAPKFSARAAESFPAPAAMAAPLTEESPRPVSSRALPPPSDSGRSWRVPIIVAAAAIALSFLTLVAVYRGRDVAASPLSKVAREMPPPVDPFSGVRIRAGFQGQQFVDNDGNIWSGDMYFHGGNILAASPRTIFRTLDQELYLTHREGDFSYRIPLKKGTYELRLHFAETVFGEGNIAGGGESSRVFSVLANGESLPVNDVLAEAGGPNTASIRVFKNIEPGPDGTLHLQFSRVKDHGFVNGIEILPSTRGQMLPLRLVAHGNGFVNAAGERWRSDRYFSGGQPVNRQEAVEGARAQELYRGERYGNFSYALPVAPNSRYSVTFHFTENWFGKGRPGGGGTGSRVFDVYCNGRTLLRNFDLLKEAGGPLRAVTRTFRGLEPNAQGKLLLMFVPVRNYALINAIEVVDEGG